MGRCRVRIHAACLAIADILRADGVAGSLRRSPRPDGAQRLNFLVAKGICLQRNGRLHRHKRKHLQQVVLDHVSHHAELVIVAGAFSNIHRLRHGYLHVVHIIAVPDGFKDGVREAQDQQILNGLFAEVVIDAIDLILAENACGSWY